MLSFFGFLSFSPLPSPAGTDGKIYEVALYPAEGTAHGSGDEARREFEGHRSVCISFFYGGDTAAKLCAI